jgi:hypothetical protein
MLRGHTLQLGAFVVVIHVRIPVNSFISARAFDVFCAEAPLVRTAMKALAAKS